MPRSPVWPMRDMTVALILWLPDSVTGSVAAERDRVTVADAVDSTASGTPAGTAVEPDGMSSHARSTRRKSNTAVEQIETDWKHAAVRPAPHVELPEWLLEETDKVAHRDYSTGFITRSTRSHRTPTAPPTSAHGW